MQTRRLRRRAAGWLVVAGAGALAATATANADVTGQVVTPGGVPVPNARVEFRDQADRTDVPTVDRHGRFSYRSDLLADFTGTVTAHVRIVDECRDTRDPLRVRTTDGVPVTDGATITLTADILPMCASYRPSGAPDATAYVDAAAGAILAPPNGIAHIRSNLIPRDAETVSVRLADGTEIGRSDEPYSVTVTAPGTHRGPLTVHWTAPGGDSGSVALGTLTAAPAPAPRPAPANFDLAAILDLSGSMSWNDKDNRRLDAMHLLTELASPGDRLLATGFDDRLRPVFPRTTIVNASTRANLRAAARRAIGNHGGTNYNVAFAQAYAGLAADPANPEVPKGAIFLTDGGHNAGPYENGHLRFAHNGTRAAWPVCVVQLGREFKPADEVRLRRIAAETGGRYLKAPNNARLESLYFQCRGATTGQRTVVKRTQTFRVGQQRTITSRVAKGQRTATFLVSWGNGRYRLALRQPGRAKPHTRTTGKNIRLVKGRTFQYFQVRNPKPGTWRLQVKRLPTGGRTDTATTTVSVQRKR